MRFTAMTRLHLTAMQVQSFWRRVNIGLKTECWNWTKGRKRRGDIGSLGTYGIVWFNGIQHGCHRVAYMLSHGSISSGKIICHTCDNPTCCNPAHLYAGTPTDNVRDATERGRLIHEHGVDRYNAILTEQNVKDIRAAYVKGHKLRPSSCDMYKLAAKYHVCPNMIFTIIHRQRWKHVA
jgi:hypothetical protein